MISKTELKIYEYDMNKSSKMTKTDLIFRR